MEFNFTKLAELLFNNHLLAHDVTVHSVLKQYEYAVTYGEHSVGLMKRPINSRRHQVTLLEGSKGTKVGLIKVHGAMTYEETGWEGLCGMTSYENLQGQAEYLIKVQGVDELILEVNSGGGQAYGIFEASQAVRKLANEHNVRISSYVDGVAYSGGYIWASIADEVVVNPMGRVGSIGVVLPLVNYSERDKKNGIKRVYVTSGKSKVPYDSEGNFTEEALADFQKSSQEIYEEFVKHVVDHRGMAKQSVLDTEAKTFSAKDALGLGMIDKVMTKNEFLKNINDHYGESSMTLINLNAQGNSQVKTQTPDTPAVTANEAETKVEGANVQVQELEARVSKLTKDLEVANSEKVEKDELIKTLQDKVTALEADAEAKVASTRRERIAEVVSADEVDDVMDIAESLSDEKFDKYVATLSTKQTKTREEMREVGSGGVEVEVENEGDDKVKASNDLAELAKSLHTSN
jgi:signal peptide peptidase SppA